MIDQITKPPAVASLVNVSKCYLTGGVPVKALDCVSFTVAHGDYISITGPSGSGKSTLLNLIGLLDRPDAGNVRVAGVETIAMDDSDRTRFRGAQIGFVFQALNLLPYRTALENVSLPLMYARVPKEQRVKRSKAMLDKVGLLHKASALANQLSGGERQRVAIARSLAPAPSFLLCDEPTGNLDSFNTSAVMNLFDQIHSQGTTIVVVTHDDHVAARANINVELTDGHLTSRPRP